MKAIYFPYVGRVEPFWSDFRQALGEFPITLGERDGQLAEQLQGVRIVVDTGASRTPVAMIDSGAEAGVELWQVIGTGLDKLDIPRLRGYGIRVANTPGQFSALALAEHALFLMLCLAKKLRASQESIRSGIFYTPVTEELHGATLGLVGFGASARCLATRARALGMRVIAVDEREIILPDQEAYDLAFAGGSERLGKLLAQSDYVSVHVPLLPSTRGLIGARELGLMKPTACLVNVARGPIVDEEALAEALRAGTIRGAGLDAFGTEPLPAGHPFLELPNVIATPHLAGFTDGTMRRRNAAAAENIRRFAQGLPIQYEVF